MSNRIVTSIKIEEDLWKDAKKKAIDEGMTLAEFLEECVRKQLRRNGGK